MSRKIPPTGSVYWSVPNDMPGVGPYSRFRVAAPGRLVVLERTGATRVLVDGGNPTASSLNLIDVNAPDVSYDGRKILFAGFSKEGFNAAEDTRPLANPHGWRLYVINADGSGLRQITTSDQNLDYSQFGSEAGPPMRSYDDTDPAWLPDGRIVFSSTRWPAFAQYGGARASNLHIVNADGSGMHRITAERNGADRPMVDPSTGEIVFSRWWRNHRFATNSMATIAAPNGGFQQKDGLTMDRGGAHLGGFDFLFRNNWHAAAIHPDGTGLVQWAGPHDADDGVHSYGGAFGSDGALVANYFPMTNMTEAGGFGGLRRYHRRSTEYEPLIGITKLVGNQYVNASNPTSFGVYKGSYASDPAVLADGRIVLSWASSITQDYGLYLVDRNGQNRTLLYDAAGTTELRAKLLQARPVPPILSDSVSRLNAPLPPRASGPFDVNGTFTFDALNVYANGPVDSITVSAPKVGSASKIRFFADFQRTNPGSFESLDWPILLAERTVNADGSVRETAPAGIPLFEQIRSGDGTVPLTTGSPGGAAHVAGMNFGMTGEVSRCVGCHSGHTQIPVPASDEEAKWSNLAPGAVIRVSSSRNGSTNKGLTDRKVQKGNGYDYWTAAGATGEWVELVFPQQITVRNVRLYNPRSNTGSTLQVQSATVRVGAGGNQWAESQTSGALNESGVDVNFANAKGQVVRVELGGITGRGFDGSTAASLAEIEVIAHAGTPGAPSTASNRAPTIRIDSPTNGASMAEGAAPLRATANDPEEGDLGAKIVWRSSIAGEIGRGASISPSLKAGVHTITASVVDAKNAAANATINLTITGASTSNALPAVTILAPASGTTVQEGNVTFQGKATDAEDGDLSAKLVWRSNLMGEIGKGPNITAKMTAGNHVILAFVTDSGNKGNGVTVNLNVTKGPSTPPAPKPNTAPIINILSPANGISMKEGVAALTAAASDAEDGAISSTIVWRSNLAGEIGRGASITPALKAGNHVITASVTDSKGSAASASVSIQVLAASRINLPPTVTILRPTHGATVQAGVPITLQATATDPEDGDVASKVVWIAGSQGYLGTGGTLTVTLKPGKIWISARAFDSNGFSTETKVLVAVIR